MRRMRAVAALAVVVALAACSDEAGGWRTYTLADGRLSFDMPRPALHGSGTAGLMPDLPEFEGYDCIDGACEYSVSVHKSRTLPGRLGTTEEEHVRWASSHLNRIARHEAGCRIEHEGDWTQGKLRGRWVRVALPPKPPVRMVPMIRWLYAAAWEGQAVVVTFAAPQDTYNHKVRGPAARRDRERFVASIAVE